MSDEYQSPPPAPPVAPPPAGMTEGPSDTGKILAGLGYLTGIVAIIAILMDPYKNERFVRVHAFQAIGLWVVSLIAGLLNVIPILGQIIWLVASIAVLVFAIIGAIKAFQGQEYEMPLVYGFIKNYV